MNIFSSTAIYAFIWLAAFISALMLFPAYEAQSVLLSVSALAAGLCFIVLKHPFQNGVSKEALIVIALLCAFWTLALLSVALSEVPFVSFIYFCFFSVLPLSFFWMILLHDRPGFIKYTAIGLNLIALALSLLCLTQYFTRPDMLFYGRVHWPFANPNSLAGLLSLFFFMGLSGLFSARQKTRKYFFLALSILVFLALITTVSRGAILSLILFVVIFFSIAGRQIQSRMNMQLLTGIAAGMFLIIFISPEGALSPLRATHQTLSGEYSTLWSSPALWAGTWSIIKNYLWAGTGIGTFFLYYPQYRSGDFYTSGLMAHSDPLQFWAEMGLLAPLLFYALTLSALIFTIRAIKILKPDDPKIIRLLAPACGLGAMILHSHITYNFYVLPSLMLAGGFTGYWLCAMNDVLQTQQPAYAPMSEITRIHMKTLGLALLSAGLFIFIMMQGSLIVISEAQKAAAKNDMEGLIQGINHASALSQKNGSGAYVLAAALPLSILESSDISHSEKEELVAQALTHLDHAAKLNPRQSDIFYTKARVFKVLNNLGAAETELLKALSLNPSHLPARQMLSDLYTERGKMKKAFEVMKEGLPWTRMPRDSKDFLERLALLSLEMGDMETHKEAMKMLTRQVVIPVNKTGIARNAFVPPQGVVLDLPK